MNRVLDASVLLAFLHAEPGASRARQALPGALVSTVNWAEVVQKSLRRSVDVRGMREEFEEAGVTFAPFAASQAEIAAHLWEKTRRHGLSLADRACLSLAIEKRTDVLTADRSWADLTLDIEIELLR